MPPLWARRSRLFHRVPNPAKRRWDKQVELANEYLSAVQAHTTYFDNADVANFIMRRVCTTPDEPRFRAEPRLASIPRGAGGSIKSLYQ